MSCSAERQLEGLVKRIDFMRTMVQYHRPTDSCSLALVRETEQGIYRQRRRRRLVAMATWC